MCRAKQLKSNDLMVHTDRPIALHYSPSSFSFSLFLSRLFCFLFELNAAQPFGFNLVLREKEQSPKITLGNIYSAK